METGVKEATPAPTRNSGLGMTMHGKVVLELRRLNLGARPNLTPVFQQKHKRWMIAGEEGGGCNGELGHYIGFAGVVPDLLAVSIPIQSLIPNSTHATRRLAEGREMWPQSPARRLPIPMPFR